jgi:hypothetical protein
MTHEVNEDIWNELDEDRPQYGHYNARSIGGISKIILAVNHNGTRNILLPIRRIEDAVYDNHSRGIIAQGKVLILEDEEEGPYILITCTDNNGNKAFNLVASDVLQNLDRGMVPSDAVAKTLEKWRKFWGGAHKQILSEEQIKGLFGELWFLLVWLLPKDLNWVVSWLGPCGHRNDFEKSKIAIEVKTTSSIRGHIHRINGLDQLDPPEEGILYCFSLRVRREGTAINTIPLLVSRIKSQLATNQPLLDLFEERLALIGYSSVHDEEYSEYKYRTIDERLYVVDDHFPRLTQSLFNPCVPNGVERIDYDVNLEVCLESVASYHPNDIKFDDSE